MPILRCTSLKSKYMDLDDASIAVAGGEEHIFRAGAQRERRAIAISRGLLFFLLSSFACCTILRA